ncbi:MAG: uracil-DNA glycosylase [Planctomycetaceae bacterium]|jgi:DNA polymerase|nr:uracil-DNA glycosylase [Planctomycetaceae bacterium]
MYYQGLADYLSVMQLSGVSELPLAAKVAENRKPAAAGSKQTAKAEAPTPAITPEDTPAATIIQETAQVSPLAAADGEIVSGEESALTGGRLQQLQVLADEVALCKKCSELAAVRCRTVFGSGNPNAELVFIGEAPGADEDKQGEPFVGRAGQLLTDIIVKGMNLRREDVYICNILRCRPPGNRNPLPAEAAACRPFLEATLDIIKPKFICCLGATAAQNLLHSEQTIGRLRGSVLDYRNIKVICTYHPAYLLRNPAAKKDTWNDIQILMREMGLIPL